MRGFGERKGKVGMLLNVKLCYNLKNKIKRECQSLYFQKYAFHLFLERWHSVMSLFYTERSQAFMAYINT